MELASSEPGRWRIIAAFVLAPVAAAVAAACIAPFYAGLPTWGERVYRSALVYCLVGAYPATLIFGLPLFAVLNKHARPSLMNCAKAGAVTAAMPAILLVLLAPQADYAVAEGRISVLEGRATLWGWWIGAKLLAFVGCLGAFGGTVFWSIITAGLKKRPLLSVDEN